jgi:hypothetical protein
MARFNLNLGSQTELGRSAAKAFTPADAEAETLEAPELQCDGWIWDWIGDEYLLYIYTIALKKMNCVLLNATYVQREHSLYGTGVNSPTEIGQASNEELLAAGRPIPDASSDKDTKAGTYA